MARLAISGGALALVALHVVAFGGCTLGRETAPRGRQLAELGIVATTKSDARIDLPATADGFVAIAPPRSKLAVRYRLRGANAVAAHLEDGASVYPGAIEAFDLVQVPLVDGIEDFVFFDHAPKEEALVYELDTSRVAGMRLVENVLELLDDAGVPRLRVERPWLRDAMGTEHALSLDVEGCKVDRNRAVPWDRPVTPLGAASCTLVVSWAKEHVHYPALVDPDWKLTGSHLPRHDIASIVFPNGNVLALHGTVSKTGLGNGPSDSGDLYDPGKGAWTFLGFVGNPRQEGSLALLPSGKALYTGGDGSSRPDIVGPDGSVMRAQMDTSFFFARGSQSVALPSGKVLVAGGSGAAAQLYDEPTDTYAPASTGLNAARAFHTMTLLSTGKVLIAGGTNTAGTKLASAELYDPALNTFTMLTPVMTTARARHTASRLADGTVLLAFGGSATAEIYDPVANTFTATAAAAGDRSSPQAVILASGDVMALGGDAGGPSPAVEIFDLATKKWSSQPPLAFARRGFGAGRLPNGDVIAFAGIGALGLSIGNAEIWKPGAPGTTCKTGDDCKSGACEEGICCAAACAALCQTCAPATGACVTVTKADDASSCTGTNTCDGAGACKKKNGQACAAATECASAFCIDGTCCDKACGGQCEACDVPGQKGTCAPVAGAPHGARPVCVAGGTLCGGVCNGLEGSGCAYPSAITTCGASCSGADLQASLCDGRGACLVDAPRACPGNFVCATRQAPDGQSGSGCMTSCTKDADCRADYRCEGGVCLPIALCEERFVTKGTTKIDCYPYTCEQTGNCREACASVSDCAAPTICNFDGKCVDPPPLPDPSCSSAPQRTARFGAGAIGVLFALGMLCTRRRRA